MVARIDRLTVAGILGTAIFFLAWEALSRSGLVNAVMLPAPSMILTSAWELLASGELLRHFGASLFRAAVGFAAGAALAVALGTAMAHVNLIPLNPTPGSRWTASRRRDEDEFVRRLRAKGVPVTVRDTRGREIDGACGQLAAHET